MLCGAAWASRTFGIWSPGSLPTNCGARGDRIYCHGTGRTRFQNFCNQIRDASSSACRNTSEGFGRFRPAENARFLEFAHASLSEVQDGLIEAREKKYISSELHDRLWVLSRRALGANANYMKYCATARAQAPNPGNLRTQNLRTLEPYPPAPLQPIDPPVISIRIRACRVAVSLAFLLAAAACGKSPAAPAAPTAAPVLTTPSNGARDSQPGAAGDAGRAECLGFGDGDDLHLRGGDRHRVHRQGKDQGRRFGGDHRTNQRAARCAAGGKGLLLARPRAGVPEPARSAICSSSRSAAPSPSVRHSRSAR